ncbi:uncharacterized protein LOC123197059 isoform X2 [Mangifera indica]|uniref:uncharacterized protein LOC123197059 isoform X2 n=1 Tax=Mangifera indica TaxID=29780 RepID=UPI001CFBBC5D|nr:uncharacterized protein LOC123197059 isoform X2 [Mangifera indica]
MGCGVSRFDLQEAGPGFDGKPKRNVSNSNIEYDATLPSEQLMHVYGGKEESLPDRRDNNDRSLSAGDPKDQLGGFDRKFKSTAEERGGDSGGEEANGSFSDREDDIAYPGSPSFRDYCVYVEPKDDINEGMTDGKRETNKAETGSGAESRRRRRLSGKGLIKSAMHRPAGWMQRKSN